MSRVAAPNNEQRLCSSFSDDDGNPVDPAAVYVAVSPPSGPDVSYVATRDAKGEYHYDLLLDQPGTWSYYFFSVETVIAQSPTNTITVASTFAQPTPS